MLAHPNMKTTPITPFHVLKVPFTNPRLALPKKIHIAVEISLTFRQPGTQNTASCTNDILPQVRVREVGGDP